MRLFSKPALQTTFYTLPAGDKLQNEVRIAFLSDLHGEAFGKQQEQLFAPIRAFSPDLVLFGGDTFDERVPWETAAETLRLSAASWQTFYTPGNHEIKTGDVKRIKQTAVATGARLLAGSGFFPALCRRSAPGGSRISPLQPRSCALQYPRAAHRQPPRTGASHSASGGLTFSKKTCLHGKDNEVKP